MQILNLRKLNDIPSSCAHTPAELSMNVLSFPLQVFFKEASVKQVDVPTLTGAFGILPAHVPTLQVLRPGVVTVFSDDGSSAKYFGKVCSLLELKPERCGSGVHLFFICKNYFVKKA